ncbi:hypothetical protein RGQ15_13075 [Paracoccus sp. MBLB3053]|uniref:Nickel/cobalt efflux system n=1 Tax=Paracoccus aurantius TaxID=3073814 RepID=A0ABU2HVC0_9RHOB|nr:hypothetical protein [Paracoccus sp. MBLB3053]MDS9468500.1 hypothetical protein [Paracoccus sp. MBLB3053]
MRRALILASGLLAVLLLVMVWQHHAQIVAWATAMQRDAQNGLARSLQALKAGNPGALAKLMGLCLAYGFFHAVGPGHGKFLVGAYSTSRSVPIGRLVFATVASSLGQAVTAVALVLAGISLFALSRQQLTTLAETTLTQLSLISIMLIGVWIVLRGAARGTGLVAAKLAASRHEPPMTNPGHHHHDHAHLRCPSCGHAHAPSADDIAMASGWRELASMILAIAIRPCSGAILLLVLTWQMNILGAGIAGAFAMATGTACLTLLVAVMGSSLRKGAMEGFAQSPALRAVGASLEIAAGLAVLILAAEGLGLV